MLIKRTSHIALGSFVLLLSAATAMTAQDQPVGYDDTPLIPDQQWRVHDPNRPQPRTVSSERFSEMAAAPSDATVLFDGTDYSKWRHTSGKDVGWKIVDDYMEVVGGTGSIVTRDEFGDFQLHLEFATPSVVDSSSQGRGNSGVIIYGLYEVQVLDSWQNRTYADGSSSALYGQFPPRVNAARPPGEWQTYDIVFEAPRWDGETLTKKANVTVLHNGVLVHNRQEFNGPTAHKAVRDYEKHPEQGFILLQDHRNPTRFRNIWIRALTNYDDDSQP